MAQTILLSDTTWTTGSIVNLTSDVQVAPGVTLTVEPGVTVNATAHEQIAVYGTLRAIGTSTQKILFRGGVQINFGTNFATPGRIELQHADVVGGAVLPSNGYGSFDISDSKFTSVEGFYIWYPTQTSRFDRNIFLRSSGINVLRDSDRSVYIANNVFAAPQEYAVQSTANYSATSLVNTFVSGNSFLSTDKVALSIGEGYTNTGMVADGNYFGTTEVAVINAMILDRNDSLTRNAFVDYTPFLNAPAAQTPYFEKIKQTIGPISTSADVSVVGSSAFIFATATSELAVGFRSLSVDVCNISSNVLTRNAVGICVVEGYQAGDSVYNKAPEVTRTFTVSSVDNLPCGASQGQLSASCSVEISTNNWVISSSSFAPTLPAPPPLGTTFPVGVLSLQLVNGVHGSNVNVVVRFGSPVPVGSVYMKYGKTQNNQTDHWYQLPAERAVFSQDRLSFTLTLTDGGLGDTDLLANGSISDPGGPALLSASSPVSIPTLSQWGMILLASLMGLGTFVAMRKRTG